MADAFDKFYKEVLKAVNNVKTRSEIMAESIKIKNQIKTIEDENSSLFKELGRMTYASFQNDIPNEERVNELKEKSNEIREKEKQIGKLKQMLKDLELKEASKVKGKKAIGKCPNCGAIIYEGDKFCGECGFKLPELKDEKALEDQANVKKELICPNCGFTNPVGSNFCVKCGTPLSSNNNDLKQE